MRWQRAVDHGLFESPWPIQHRESNVALATAKQLMGMAGRKSGLLETDLISEDNDVQS